MMAEDNDNGNIYLGFDLSTQQLKGDKIAFNFAMKGTDRSQESLFVAI